MNCCEGFANGGYPCLAAVTMEEKKRVASAVATDEHTENRTDDQLQSEEHDGRSEDGRTEESFYPPRDERSDAAQEEEPRAEKPKESGEDSKRSGGFWRAIGVIVPLTIGGVVLVAAVGWLLDQMASNAPSGGGLLIAILAPAGVGVIAAGLGLLTTGQRRKERDDR